MRSPPAVPGYHELVYVGPSRIGEVWRGHRRQDGRMFAIKTSRSAQSQFIAGHRAVTGIGHPNLAAVTEHITVDGQPVVIMEWIGGGTLAERLAQGIDVWTLGDIALGAGHALDALHQSGLVHGDIRSEHILFRRDGTPVITGFDLCAAPGPRTPEYEDPLAFRPSHRTTLNSGAAIVTPANDVYDLGCLLYECLAGRPPFSELSDTDPLEGHARETVLRLPAHLESFQWVLERALAKQPENRFSSAGELASSFAEIARRSSAGSIVLRTDAVDPQEILWVGTPILENSRRNDAGKRRKRKLREFPGVRFALGIGIILLMSFWVAALLDRSETAVGVLAILGWVRDPAVVEAWDNARALDRDPNQSLVTVAAGYRRVLALDPTDSRARQALDASAAEWRVSIERALAAGQVNDANERLREYLRVFPGDETMSSLAQQVKDRRNADALINRALATLRRQGFADPEAIDTAIRTYREVLRLVPEHPVARSELDGIAAEAARQAQEAMEAADYEQAVRALDRAAAASPDLALLAEVRREVLASPDTQTRLRDLLAQGEQLQTSGALIVPDGNNAAEIYLRVLAIEPDNQAASESLLRLVEQVASEARGALNLGNLEHASQLVSRFAELGLDRSTLEGVRRSSRVSLKHHTLVVQNLELARTRLARGLITAPENDNALLFLRRVLDQDPSNQLATTLISECAARIVEVAREAYAADMKNLGRGYLEKALELRPAESDWLALRERWNRND
ncbi:MAG: protein kinase domain-containing protein [Pseudomonadales bacterium]